MQQRVHVLVDNQPGVLAKVAALYAERGVNIDSFSVHPVQGSELSRMLIVTSCEPDLLTGILGELERLAEVLKVERERKEPEEQAD
ncbi:ACT domain-containing protein [Brevibacillus humidisoli]|uniref:ACT domain-containing protein n=1 Tax=Brevibacillus humidisoli TaxID=2895522 RepID=UPI001E31EF0B|nr:ACT domain-containing protein [Brevibacillus humidisoli]UFJ39585.1 ACT domain-containing protein [Brevibacillus humidisoli]